MALEVRPTRVIQLIEDGKFDDVLKPMGTAVLNRLKVLEKRQQREEALRKRRERANARRKGTGQRSKVINK